MKKRILTIGALLLSVSLMTGCTIRRITERRDKAGEDRKYRKHSKTYKRDAGQTTYQ